MLPAKEQDQKADLPEYTEAEMKTDTNQKEEMDKKKKNEESDFVLEFEPGLHKLLKEKQTDKAPETDEKDESALDFDLSSSEKESITRNEESQRTTETPGDSSSVKLADDDEDHQSSEIEVLSDPLKSKEALDTLLALANTYISMGDIESARQSLEEVVEHGSDKQQTEAKRLLKDLGQ
ncbi:FimV protein [Legionella israelensis]|uniref:FimV protein n=6 Tax=Legionella israelensis TaxID=454 RepID=A0A0W0VHQ2_9GAMM|nr:FimV protein [Legionella israelensis]